MSYRQGYKVFDIVADKSGRKRKYGPFSNVEFKAGPGKWTPDRKPVMCETGWHFFRHIERAQALVASGYGREIWLIEYKGRTDDNYAKSCAQSIRLIKKLTNGVDYGIKTKDK